MGTRVRGGGRAEATDEQGSAAGVAPTGEILTEHRNEVIIAGRLSAAALAKELPSGDEIVVWRLIVDRPAAVTAQRVDVVDCTAYAARVRRQALGWHDDDVIEVTGALRRRFWRGVGGLQSRCEVEVGAAKRLRAAGRGAADGAVRRRRKPG